MKYFLQKTDIVSVSRTIVNLNDSTSVHQMTVQDAIDANQWDTTNGTVHVHVNLDNYLDVEKRAGHYVKYGNLNNCTVFKIGKSAYIYLLDDYKVENYQNELESMKKWGQLRELTQHLDTDVYDINALIYDYNNSSIKSIDDYRKNYIVTKLALNNEWSRARFQFKQYKLNSDDLTGLINDAAIKRISKIGE